MSLFEVNNISFSYGEHLIFSDISFSIDKGDVLCILGTNGTGKTTLIKCLNGLNDINSGEILINGKNIHLLRKFLNILVIFLNHIYLHFLLRFLML